MVAESRLESDFLSLTNTGPNLQRAMTKCSLLPWCVCVCQESDGTFAVTDLLVTGGVTDTQTGTKVPCWSKRPKPAIFPAPQAVATSSAAGFPKRKPANLLDGVYGYDIEECSYTDTTDSSAYILVDLSDIKVISRVTIRFQPKGIVEDKHLFDILVGNASSTGPFDNYKLFASNKHPVSLNEEVTHERTDPIYGRYVAFESGPCCLQICHLEIF